MHDRPQPASDPAIRPRRGPSHGIRSRGSRIALAVAAAAVLSASLVVAATPPRASAVDVFGALRDRGEPAFIVGHRGDRAEAPENTMPALEAGLDGPMAFIETDVRLSRDGVPVLIHDGDLERVAGRPGRVADATAAELASTDVGSWYSPAYAGVGVPQLDELLEALAVRPHARALLELKGDWTAEQVRGIAAAVEEAGVRSQVVLQSFSLAAVESAQRAAPFLPRILLMRELPADPTRIAERYGVIAIATTAKSVKRAPGAVELLHEAGVGVLTYTLNSEDTWEVVRALGVDGIITDRPSDLDEWIAETAPGT
ncbi:glycerophosphodiester phosphodiesterase [Agromyces archimandritae]|uniref:GP-PDE domain-containing protein n=1 Tax=Agromyces archimandritae TaxID=2781962 RepID=A0A975FN01_9MICO|nr:glycerophosphodiester phosphodiesterase family protein [Agromyces archimandritae]QTX05094.1 hypothetical protein G127AT_02315 [Agromyces archimandritae]